MLSEKIRKKLKSEQGTSIFFGLLLFLVASILSVVTVSYTHLDVYKRQNIVCCQSPVSAVESGVFRTVSGYRLCPQ